MNERSDHLADHLAKHLSQHHDSFVIEREYPASPARVFAAWSDPIAKGRWFAGPSGWKAEVRELDFRVGGRERTKGLFPDGHVSDFQSVYHDIVRDRRIVYSYTMHLDEVLISVSLGTVVLEPAGTGTRLVYTEQAVYLDGYDDAGSRERGTRGLLDNLAASLKG